MGAIQSSINQALGVAAALSAPGKALKEQEQRQAVAKASELAKATKREKTRLEISNKGMEEAISAISKLNKPIENLNKEDIGDYKSNLEGGIAAFEAASKQSAKSSQALYELTGKPAYAEGFAKLNAGYGRAMSLANSMRQDLNRRETDLLKAQMANKRAQEIQQAKKQIREQAIKKRQTYLDQPLSIGGKEIGTVRGLPKDLRSQVKEGLKNARK